MNSYLKIVSISTRFLQMSSKFTCNAVKISDLKLMPVVTMTTGFNFHIITSLIESMTV